MRRIPLLVLLVIPLAFGTAHADRSESHTYVGGTGDALILACPDPDCPAEYIGGALFTLEGDETVAAVAIEDELVDPVGGFYQFQAGDTVLSEGAFCGTISVEVPLGASSLEVFVDEVLGPLDCPGDIGAATIGTVKVDFTS